MKGNERTIKSGVHFQGVLFVILCTILMGSIHTFAFADIDTPRGLGWKEGSIATAIWDEAEGADYYEVRIYAYDDNTMIGNKTIRTSDHELDLFQNIYDIIKSSAANNVQVAFQVAPGVVMEDGREQQGVFSEVSKIIRCSRELDLYPSHKYVPDSSVLPQNQEEYGYNYFGSSENIQLATASTNSISCEFTGPEYAQVGHQCTISYELSGGSGNYSDISIAVAAMCEMPRLGGSSVNIENYQLESSSGEFTFICPAASDASISVHCHDDVTGEDYWKPYRIPLEQNPDFPVTITCDKEEYYSGDSITVSYSIGGQISALKDSRVFWGIQKSTYSPDIPVSIQEIDSPEGTVTYQPMYGDNVMFYLQAEDYNGNIIFGQSQLIKLETITADIAQKLPNSLTRIEFEAFAGTSIIAIEIPASVTYIDEHAFDNCNIRLIVGHNEYVREFALNHGIAYNKQ